MSSGAEVVQRAYEGLSRRDADLLMRLAHADFEMDLTERVLNPATYRGAEGVARFLEEVDELWTSMEIEVERMVEHRDEVLAVLLVTLRGRGSGVALESRIGQQWTLLDGKLLRMRLRTDAEAAVAEFEARGG